MLYGIKLPAVVIYCWLEELLLLLIEVKWISQSTE